MNVCLRWLARRRLTIREIYQRLSKKFPDMRTEFPAVISRLEAMGYLDDYAYVQAYVRDRIKFRPRGTPLLRMELFKKGVAKDVVENAIYAMEQAMQIDQKEIAERLAVAYTKRSSYKRAKNPKASLYRYLVSKGIPTSLVSTLIQS